MLSVFSRPAQGTVSGQQAVTATATALPDTVVGEVILKASIFNLIPVFIGPDANVTVNTGYELGPGEAVVLDHSNLKEVFAIASTTGAKLTWYGKKIL